MWACQQEEELTWETQGSALIAADKLYVIGFFFFFLSAANLGQGYCVSAEMITITAINIPGNRVDGILAAKR